MKARRSSAGVRAVFGFITTAVLLVGTTAQAASPLVRIAEPEETPVYVVNSLAEEIAKGTITNLREVLHYLSPTTRRVIGCPFGPGDPRPVLRIPISEATVPLPELAYDTQSIAVFNPRDLPEDLHRIVRTDELGL
jgi:hypothetical protein